MQERHVVAMSDVHVIMILKRTKKDTKIQALIKQIGLQLAIMTNMPVERER